MLNHNKSPYIVKELCHHCKLHVPDHIYMQEAVKNFIKSEYLPVENFDRLDARMNKVMKGMNEKIEELEEQLSILVDQVNHITEVIDRNEEEKDAKAHFYLEQKLANTRINQ